MATSSNTTIYVAVGALFVICILAYFLRNWLKNKTAPTSSSSTSSSSTSSSSTSSDQVAHNAVIDSGEPDEVLHAVALDRNDEGKRLVPPGGFPVTGCLPSDLHSHVAKEYALYQSEPESKAFVVHQDCEQSYAIYGQSDTITATKKAYQTCNKKTPGHCGVLAVNDVVYSHTN